MPDASALIARQLEQHTHAVRIKKLLLYACKDWWESDSARLSVISLEQLVGEIRQAYPTLEQLRSRLTHLVGTLNKSADYQFVAKTITAKLSALYPAEDCSPGNEGTGESDREESTQFISPNLPETQLTTPYTKIAKVLSQHVQLSRIKKLLICVCRRYWEANPYVIEQTLLSDLLSELTQLYSTPDRLRAGLAAAVKTLNKPMEYALVAETILQAVEPLYASPSADQDTKSRTDEQPAPLSNGAQESFPVKEDLIDLFDVRLEIFKYANPLRAKILLFSLVYYRFEFRSQDWSNLKLYSLEGLLRAILSQGISLPDLHQNLQDMAHQFGEPSECSGGDRGEYLEVGHVLVKALKPNYSTLQRQLQRAIQTGSVADITCESSTQMRRDRASASLDKNQGSPRHGISGKAPA
jgi:hypothetical protein